MESHGWLREDVDERLEGLFTENPSVIAVTVSDVIGEARDDPELEDILIETLNTALVEGNDETTGSAWCAVILGELPTDEGIAVLVLALTSEDEVVRAAAARALRRIGDPATEALLEVLNEETVGADLFAAAAECFHTGTTEAGTDLRERIEERMMRELLAIPESLDRDPVRRMEVAGLTLACLGVARAREAIDRVMKREPLMNNSFLQEAIEILDEYPEGLPRPTALGWQEEFRWVLEGGLPGGEVVDPQKQASESEYKPPGKRF